MFEIDWVTGIRSPVLTAFFATITHLASSWFLLLFLPLGFWLWRKGPFGRLAVLNVLTLLLNNHLKMVYMFSRPDPSLSLAEFSGWSFPSGHAQHAVVTWMWLAWEIGKPWSWATGTFLTLSIALSRVYLGVHFGRDILAGLLVGAATFFYFQWLVAKMPVWWKKLGWPWRIGILLFFQIVWLVLIGDEVTLAGFLPAAVFIGFGCGLLVERKIGQGWKVLITVVLAGSIWLVVYSGGYFSLDSAVPALFHFALVGAWMSTIAPGLHGKLRLS